MLQKSEVCVLIPAYNEEKNIDRVIRGVLERGWNVLVVDDGSTDATAEKIRSLNVPSVFSAKNQGKGASLQKGFDWLLESPFRGVVMMDADGQHSADEIDRFVEALGRGADLVVGDRMSCPEGMSFIRTATNRTMSRMISVAAGQNVSDTQCGYRAMSRRAFEKIRLETTRFEVESEMILRAADAGLRITSVPISCLYGDEVSHIRPARDTVRFFKFYFGYLFTRKRARLEPPAAS